MDGRERWGVLAAAASSLLGGSSVVATRLVIGELSPSTLGLLRFGIGTVCLMPLLYRTRRHRPARRDIIAIALLGILFFAGFPWLFNAALSRTTAAHGALALSILPLLTLGLGALMRREAVTRAKLAGILCAMIGIAFALSGRQPVGLLTNAGAGDLLMIGTAFCGALYNVLARPYLKRYPALVFTTWAMLAGTLALALLAAVDGSLAAARPLSPSGWIVAIYLGIVGAALTFWLWSYGLEHTTPTRVAVTVTLNPIMAMGLAVPLLGEPISSRLIIGLIWVISGIALAAWPLQPRRQPLPKLG
ncbi:MAG: DMT family transporter [Alphaproteobacteria bacterium]|nr:DMT family transporter [Alphaproteobacteria bacterium]